MPEFGHSLQSRRYKLQWTNCSALPTAMWGAHATVINNSIYVTGGWCPNNNFNVYKYELENDQWSVLPPLLQHYRIPVNTNDELTVISGCHSTTNKPTALVTTFNHNRWNDTYPNLAVARLWPAVVPYHQYVIVAGGQDDNENVLDSIEVLDITKRHWMIAKTCLPKPMYWISATTCGDSFTIVGYYGADDKCYNGTFMTPVNELIQQQHQQQQQQQQQQETQQSLTSSTDKYNTKWHRLADAPYWKTSLVPNTSPPVIIGGGDKQGNTVNDITIYDDTTNRWDKIAALPINCAYTTVAVINNSIIVMGGSNETKTDDTCNATALSDVNVGQLVPCD